MKSHSGLDKWADDTKLAPLFPLRGTQRAQRQLEQIVGLYLHFGYTYSLS